jgi:hypothetical protein
VAGSNMLAPAHAITRCVSELLCVCVCVCVRACVCVCGVCVTLEPSHLEHTVASHRVT